VIRIATMMPITTSILLFVNVNFAGIPFRPKNRALRCKAKKLVAQAPKKRMKRCNLRRDYFSTDSQESLLFGGDGLTHLKNFFGWARIPAGKAATSAYFLSSLSKVLVATKW
jgi:hypothetical protein